MTKPKFKAFGKQVSPIDHFTISAIDGVSFHFSQYGEDIALLNLFGGKRNGFYVDIGAFRPRKFSNTFLLHRFFDWRGINIDASSEAISLFNQERSNDINLHLAIGAAKGEAILWKFNEPAVNTLSEKNVQRQVNRGKKVKDKETVKISPLEDVFDHFLPPGQKIDLLNVDAEGSDLEVLESNNWLKYRPSIIVVEDYMIRKDGIEYSQIYGFLSNREYRLVSHMFDTSIYATKDFEVERTTVDQIGPIFNLKEIPTTEQRLKAMVNSYLQIKEEREITPTRIKKLEEQLSSTEQELKLNEEQLNNIVRELQEQRLINKQLSSQINKLLLEQQKYEHIKLAELQIISLQEELKSRRKRNDELEEQVTQLTEELNENNKHLMELIEKKNKAEKMRHLIIKSNSWRLMRPARELKKALNNRFKKQTKKSAIQKSDKEIKKSVSENLNANSLEKKLWGGFAKYALVDLEKLKKSPDASLNERRKAAWSLMRWYYAEQQFEKSLENIQYIETIDPRSQFDLDRVLVKVKILIVLHRLEEAKEILEKVVETKGLDSNLCLAMANVHLDEWEKLQWINKIYQHASLIEIRKNDENKQLSLSNITSVVAPSDSEINFNNKISIIMPTYNSADTIKIALDSLLNQTWTNFEVLVVDDASTDQTAEVVSEYCNKDERIKLISKEKNEGAYAARNTALQFVTGDFITVHDSDDWSHPQKLELQVIPLIKNNEKMATLSYWVRVDEKMNALGPWFLKGTYLEANMSSLLVRKDVFSQIGVWDNVRVAADTEFLWRLEKVYGKNRVERIIPTVPLSLSLTSTTSLTRSNMRHIRTVKFGLRQVYREAAKWWHDNSLQNNTLYLSPAKEQRSFPAPISNTRNIMQDRTYDVIFVMSFNNVDEETNNTLNLVKRALEIGKKVAIYNWPRYNSNIGKPISAKIFRWAKEYNMDILVPEDQVSAQFVIVGSPIILNYMIDKVPTIDCHEVYVINSYTSIKQYQHKHDPRRCLDHLLHAFGKEGCWLPISPITKRIMEDEGIYPQIKNACFPASALSQFREKIVWRGDQRNYPIIGRHGSNHILKWPEVNVLKQVYVFDEKVEVKIIGETNNIEKIMRMKPKNWSLVNEALVYQFYEDIDFYVYYTRQNHIDEFCVGVIEAMGFGVPVILPPQYKDVFGEAAIYAEPEQLTSTLYKLWKNKQLYTQQADKGLEFFSNTYLESSLDQILQKR